MYVRLMTHLIKILCLVFIKDVDVDKIKISKEKMPRSEDRNSMCQK